MSDSLLRCQNELPRERHCGGSTRLDSCCIWTYIAAADDLGTVWRGCLVIVVAHEPPEIVTGFGATALAALLDIALGDVLGSCMFNLLILSLMDAVQPEPLSARASVAMRVIFTHERQRRARKTHEVTELTYKVMTKRFVVLGYGGHRRRLRGRRWVVLSPQKLTTARRQTDVSSHPRTE